MAKCGIFKFAGRPGCRDGVPYRRVRTVSAGHPHTVSAICRKSSLSDNKLRRKFTDRAGPGAIIGPVSWYKGRCAGHCVNPECPICRESSLCTNKLRRIFTDSRDLRRRIRLGKRVGRAAQTHCGPRGCVKCGHVDKCNIFSCNTLRQNQPNMAPQNLLNSSFKCSITSSIMVLILSTSRLPSSVSSASTCLMYLTVFPFSRLKSTSMSEIWIGSSGRG